jgi:putative transposase
MDANGPKPLSMPRRARLRVENLPLHIIQRGNNRGACFFDAPDYQVYLQNLGRLAESFECSVHAYVLMTNHVHLLLTPTRVDGASLLMKNLGQRYVQYVNRVYGRSGTLWEGRFRSSLVQSQRYFICCQRYIELNPVRAAMVARTGDYAWSSYRANALGVSDPLIRPHPEYLALGAHEDERQAAYRGLFEEDLPLPMIERIRAAANSGYAFGSPEFEIDLARQLGRRTVKGLPGRPAHAGASKLSPG